MRNEFNIKTVDLPGDKILKINNEVEIHLDEDGNFNSDKYFNHSAKINNLYNELFIYAQEISEINKIMEKNTDYMINFEDRTQEIDDPDNFLSALEEKMNHNEADTKAIELRKYMNYLKAEYYIKLAEINNILAAN